MAAQAVFIDGTDQLHTGRYMARYAARGTQRLDRDFERDPEGEKRLTGTSEKQYNGIRTGGFRMSSDFILMFIVAPSIGLLGFVVYLVSLFALKKKEREQKELERLEQEREMERKKKEWRKLSEYLDSNPEAKKEYWDEVERQCKLNEKYRRPIEDDYNGHFAQIF